MCVWVGLVAVAAVCGAVAGLGVVGRCSGGGLATRCALLDGWCVALLDFVGFLVESRPVAVLGVSVLCFIWFQFQMCACVLLRMLAALHSPNLASVLVWVWV